EPDAADHPQQQIHGQGALAPPGHVERQTAITAPATPPSALRPAPTHPGHAQTQGPALMARNLATRGPPALSSRPRSDLNSASEALYQARTSLRLDLDEVERQLGLAAASLASIEEGRAPLETATLDALATFYGLLPADVAQGRPVAGTLGPLRSLLEA